VNSFDSSFEERKKNLVKSFSDYSADLKSGQIERERGPEEVLSLLLLLVLP